jgi:hypothetical protein
MNGLLIGSLIVYEIIENIAIVLITKKVIMSRKNRGSSNIAAQVMATAKTNVTETVSKMETTMEQTKDSIAKRYMASTAAEMENEDWKLSEKKKIEKARDEELLVIKVAKDKAIKDFMEMLEDDFKPEEEAVKSKYKKLLEPFALLNEEKASTMGKEWGAKAAETIKAGPVGVGVETVRTFFAAFKK